MAGSEAPGAQAFATMKGKLDDGLLRGIEAMGYQHMSPVQQKILNELPSFSSDCLVQAKTGTGKTIAFLLPALHSYLSSNQSIPKGQVAILIMSPTRELALQIAKECNAVTAKLPQKLECHTVFGGTSKERDLKTFLNGDPKIVVATPGRLNDYLNDEYVAEKFSTIRTLILDEADQMLEAGFLPAITQILQRLPQKSKAQWQGMCFSATMPQKIHGVLPKVLKSDRTHLTTIDENETPTIDLVKQHSVIVPSINEVYPVLWSLLQKEYADSKDDFKAIVFGTTANQVALMHSLFTNLLAGNKDLKVFQLQSRLSQNARTRTTNEFKTAKAGIMFASDVIGRGMDFPNVSHVFQVGFPTNGEQYVHRVGRTARAGNEGRAIILLTQQESFFLKVNKKLPITPYPVQFSEIDPERQQVEGAFVYVEELIKKKAYQAWLGFNKTFMKNLQLDAPSLVQEANKYSAAIGCPEPPLIEKNVVNKMGLRGVRGLNIGTESSGTQGGRGGQGRGGPSRDGVTAGRVEKNPGNSNGGRGGGGRRGRGGPSQRGGRGGS